MNQINSTEQTIKKSGVINPEIRDEGQAVFAIRMEDAFKKALEGYENQIDGGAFLDVFDFVRVESEHMYEDCPQFDPTSNAPKIVEHLVQLAKINQCVHGKPLGIIDKQDMQGAVTSYLGIFETTGEKPTDIFMKK